MRGWLGVFFMLFTYLNGAAQPITGFTAQSAEQQRGLERQFVALPQAGNTERYLLQLTEDPHIAGSPASKAVAQYIQSEYVEWGLDARLVEYQAYLPYPEEINITLIEPESLAIDLQEPFWRFDKDSHDSRAVTPFNAYSPSGDVTAQVVYVNRGLPEDYEDLAELGLDARGKIVLVRYGGSFRGVKAKVAEEHGALGLIIYSDPEDDGYMVGDIYPYGPARPWEAIQRGSLMYIFDYPGDPLTPGTPAIKGASRLKPEKASNMARVPTTPISYGDAQHILRNLAGPEVPDKRWQGGLPFRYHVGPGPAKIHLKLKMDYQIRPIYDVITTIPGKEQPDTKIILGNHHDAWVYGAVDPNSGTSTVMEIGRAFAELLKTGWQPRRTIILAHWDAEEYGLIGSTEWVEEHKADLAKHAAIYLNIDVGVAGDRFGASAVPALDQFIQAVTRETEDPTTRESIFARWWQRENPKEFKRLKHTVPDTAYVKISRLGSGSDYTAFLQHVGVPSLSMGFGGKYGVYHSILDNFFWMKNWGDPTFEYHATMSKIGGIMTLRFAQADIFPFNYADYARAISKHVDDFEKELKTMYLEKEIELDLAPAQEKAREWQAAAESLQVEIEAALQSGTINDHINDYLMQIERDLVAAQGLPGRAWFRHRIYAPGFYTGYAAKPLPGVAEPAEEADWKSARQELTVLIGVLNKAIQTTKEATQILN